MIKGVTIKNVGRHGIYQYHTMNVTVSEFTISAEDKAAIKANLPKVKNVGDFLSMFGINTPENLHSGSDILDAEIDGAGLDGIHQEVEFNINGKPVAASTPVTKAILDKINSYLDLYSAGKDLIHKVWDLFKKSE